MRDRTAAEAGRGPPRQDRRLTTGNAASSKTCAVIVESSVVWATARPVCRKQSCANSGIAWRGNRAVVSARIEIAASSRAIHATPVHAWRNARKPRLRTSPDCSVALRLPALYSTPLRYVPTTAWPFGGKRSDLGAPASFSTTGAVSDNDRTSARFVFGDFTRFAFRLLLVPRYVNRRRCLRSIELCSAALRGMRVPPRRTQCSPASPAVLDGALR